MTLLKKIKYNARRLRARAKAWSDKDRHEGLVFVPPRFYIKDWLDEDSVIVDCGLGCDADFSRELIERYDLRSHGFDPTRKHRYSLSLVAMDLERKLILHDKAVAVEKGTCLFHEGWFDESGSLDLAGEKHGGDEFTSFEVETLTLKDLLEYLDLERIELLKMDVTGSEYEILDGTGGDVLERIDQLVIAFHHDNKGYTFTDTRRACGRLEGFGFSHFTRDNVNFLFYR